MIGHIALSSLSNRRGSVLLTLLSIVISVSLLLSVEMIRSQVKDSFTRTVSGVDLIVGAPTGQLNLLLSTVFRLGNPSGGIEWKSVQQVTDNPNVDWIIPLALGDTHNGFRVVGTSNAYFEHFRYGNKQALKLAQGTSLSQGFSAVLGADVARQLGYRPGSELILSHGLGSVSFHQHQGHPFVVAGILEETGTPVDQGIYVTLQGLEAAHETEGNRSSLRRPVLSRPTENPAENDTPAHHQDTHTEDASESPTQVTAVMLGLKSRVAALQMQYQINQYRGEPLLAILPGMALAELWQLMGNFEKLLLGISVLILIASLMGLATMLLASMRERRQEIAILRTIGAGPGVILWLIQAEALLISALGCVMALLLVSVAMTAGEAFLNREYGLFIRSALLNMATLRVIAAVLVATWLCSLIPAVVAYRQALHSGLTQR